MAGLHIAATLSTVGFLFLLGAVASGAVSVVLEDIPRLSRIIVASYIFVALMTLGSVFTALRRHLAKRRLLWPLGSIATFLAAAPVLLVIVAKILPTFVFLGFVALIPSLVSRFRSHIRLTFLTAIAIIVAVAAIPIDLQLSREHPPGVRLLPASYGIGCACRDGIECVCMGCVQRFNVQRILLVSF